MSITRDTRSHQFKPKSWMSRRSEAYFAKTLAARSRKSSNARGLNRRGAANKESGYKDLLSQALLFDTTGTIVLLCTIAQGAAVTERVGKKIRYKSIQFRMTINAGTAATLNSCSLLLVYDRRPTGALPAITDVLIAATSVSLNNDTNSGRFKILKRYFLTLTGNSTTPDTGAEIVPLECYYKFRPNKDSIAAFKALASGAIGDIEQGALYVISVGSNAAGTTAALGTLNVRTRFLDI